MARTYDQEPGCGFVTLKPDGKWVFSPDSASPRAKAYEAQITGMPAEIDYRVNGVKFDGCNLQSRDFLEAKGPGYEGLAERVVPYVGGDFFQVRTLAQMQRQQQAAPPSQVQWHVAERSVVTRLSRLARRRRLNRLHVHHTPAL